MSTKIEWCDETLNPLGWGCYGPGGTPDAPKICEGCYALRIAKKSPWCKCEKCRQFVPHWHPEALEKPLKWKAHRAIFWQDMGDLFHVFTPYGDISAVLETAIATDQHTHIFLTKNPRRYQDFLAHLMQIKNGFYGATVRNQEEADRLIPVLLELASLGFKVFISYEPAWGPVDFEKACSDLRYCGQCFRKLGMRGVISGIIAGGMTGPSARPAHPDWFRTVRDQCAAAGVPFMFKGWGEWIGGRFDIRKGKMICQSAEKGSAIGRIFWTNPGAPKVHIWNALDHYWKNASAMVGKKNSGRLLDGRTHDELPWPVRHSREGGNPGLGKMDTPVKPEYDEEEQ